MDFYHLVLVVPVVVRVYAPCRTYRLHYLWKLVHFRPVRRIEPVIIPQIYVPSVFQ